MQAAELSVDRNDEPQEDHVVVLDGVSWEVYQRLLKIRGEHSVPRYAYLEGLLEIMSPSRTHESLKSLIGCLVEVYCLEKGIRFCTYGSWTLKNKKAKSGVEPDECYVFGPARDAKAPDLAIEVIWTSGGLDKLDIYRKLKVREVWVWRRGVLTPHLLRGEKYAAARSSELLPELSLKQLGQFLDRPTTSDAMLDYREALRAR